MKLKAVIIILSFSIATLLASAAGAEQEKPFVITPGATKLFFIELGKTSIKSITDTYNSPLLQDPYWPNWVLQLLPDSSESGNFLSLTLSRCKSSEKDGYLQNCSMQFALDQFDDKRPIQSIHFINPRYKFQINGTIVGVETNFDAVSKALGRKLTTTDYTEDNTKKDCEISEGIESCCPHELKNICFNRYILSPDSDKIGGWTLLTPK